MGHSWPRRWRGSRPHLTNMAPAGPRAGAGGPERPRPALGAARWAAQAVAACFMQFGWDTLARPRGTRNSAGCCGAVYPARQPLGTFDLGQQCPTLDSERITGHLDSPKTGGTPATSPHSPHDIDGPRWPLQLICWRYGLQIILITCPFCPER